MRTVFVVFDSLNRHMLGCYGGTEVPTPNFDRLAARGVTFDNLKVRYHPKVKLEVHIDTDEGNACHLQSATRMELIK